jgi:hypothetical protein
MNLTAIMDGLGAQITAWGGVPNVYTYPVGAVTVPCAIVDYPSHIDLAVTMQRGGDHVVLPVLFLVGESWTKDSRDALSAVIAGGSDLADAIEGAFSYGDIDTIDAEVTTVTVSGIAYLALKITVDVAT